ncbi:MAG: deoxyribonuclease IV [Chloroflexi bacterium]|nr:deoxyribonuclease IV [Chloroflexota bacterium]
MRLGAHVSTAGGPVKAFDRALEIGAETIQIFASSPRAWKFKMPTDEQASEFRQKGESTGVGPVFLHGSYLVNVGGSPELVEKSIDCLTNNLVAASKLGAEGVIFHGGSHKGKGFDAVLGQAAESLKEVLRRTPDDVWLIIENSAGMGFHIGASFVELGRMVEAIDDERVKICLDTEHCFAAGYNIADSEGVNDAMEEFDREIGLDRLVAVHANDAKVEHGSGVDRHENIGDGFIGLDGFEVIMSHPAFENVPFLLEVPGADKKGPDKENMDRLKAIRHKLEFPA